MGKNRICINGDYRDMTPAEIAEMEAANAQSERDYWQNTPYDEAVDAEIRKRYSVSQEFAILRQKEEKPEEYVAYYAYCEECKAFVKAKKGDELT
jgi:hypothetical protein